MKMRVSMWKMGTFGAALVLLGAAGCNAGEEGVGDACMPNLEFGSTFGGFTKDDNNVETRSFQCATRVCLINKFQGRVSCPAGSDAKQPEYYRAGYDAITLAEAGDSTAAYKLLQAYGGQIPKELDAPTAEEEKLNKDARAKLAAAVDQTVAELAAVGLTANKNDPASLEAALLSAVQEGSWRLCQVPGTDGRKLDHWVRQTVLPQFQQRAPAASVYCSCRCADAKNQQPETGNFCECPSGFACQAMFNADPNTADELEGYYCVRDGQQEVVGGVLCNEEGADCTNNGQYL